MIPEWLLHTTKGKPFYIYLSDLKKKEMQIKQEELPLKPQHLLKRLMQLEMKIIYWALKPWMFFQPTAYVELFIKMAFEFYLV